MFRGLICLKSGVNMSYMTVAGDQKKQAHLIARHLNESGGVGDPPVVEELQSSMNRGSRMFIMQQKRAEKFTIENAPEVVRVVNGGAGIGGTGTRPGRPKATGHANIAAPPVIGWRVYRSPWEVAVGVAEGHAHPAPDTPPATPTPATPFKSFNRSAVPFTPFSAPSPSQQHHNRHQHQNQNVRCIDQESATVPESVPNFNRRAAGFQLPPRELQGSSSACNPCAVDVIRGNGGMILGCVVANLPETGDL